MLDLAQLLRVPHVDSGLSYGIAPDGMSAVFAWNRTGLWELHRYEFDNSRPPLGHQQEKELDRIMAAAEREMVKKR